MIATSSSCKAECKHGCTRSPISYVAAVVAGVQHEKENTSATVKKNTAVNVEAIRSVRGLQKNVVRHEVKL